MNNNNPQNEQALKEHLEHMPVELVLAAQCASVCSCFVSGAFISASEDEPLNELFKRHKGALNEKTTKRVFAHVLTYGLATGVLNKENNNKYSPTEMGWFMGQDWDLKMRHNNFNVGV